MDMRKAISHGEVPDYLIRVARQADLPAIQTTAAASWRATYGTYMQPTFIENFLARAYSLDVLGLHVSDPKSRFLVVEAGSEVVGFGQVGPALPRRDDAPVAPADLFRLYLLPDWQRRGIGRVLLGKLEGWLRAQGYSRYGAYVHVRNEPAKSFYQSRGFIHVPDCDVHDEWYLIKELM